MGQMGHTDPAVTLGLYAQVMSVGDKDRERFVSLEGSASGVFPPAEDVAHVADKEALPERSAS